MQCAGVCAFATNITASQESAVRANAIVACSCTHDRLSKLPGTTTSNGMTTSTSTTAAAAEAPAGALAARDLMPVLGSHSRLMLAEHVPVNGGALAGMLAHVIACLPRDDGGIPPVRMHHDID